MFRCLSVAPLIMRLYHPRTTDGIETLDSNKEYEATKNVREDDTEVQDALALPPVLPMKAALYFDSADGFGEWRILISTRADRDLRQARRRDAKTFAIFIKKIK